MLELDDHQKLIITGKICPFCLCETELVTGHAIYPHIKRSGQNTDFLDKKYYQCKDDKNHYVGTYGDNLRSLGSLADDELRKIRHSAHNLFDPLWRDRIKFRYRRQAYRWLSHRMEKHIDLTHFGMFNKEECKRAIGFIKTLIDQ